MMHLVMMDNKKEIQPAWFEQATSRLTLTNYSLVLIQLS